MKKRIGLITLLLCLFCSVHATDMEQRFMDVKELYEQRDKSALKALREYIKNYPYTTYRSEVYMMTGVLQVEKQRYKNALKAFDEVKWKQLERGQQPTYLFYRGYAFAEVAKFPEAASCFKTLKNSTNPYTLQAKYYYAYCWYLMKDYQKALPEFLAIEHTSQYKDIVPYYIIQIYYLQGQYDEVYERAEYLLTQNPQNEYNAEINRIMGEIYYSKQDYANAAKHLLQYEKAFSAKKLPLVREDLYLLAMSEFQVNKWQEAIEHFKQVKQQKDTISESTCLNMGHAYIKMKDVEKAKLAYSAAMTYNLTPSVHELAMFNYALTTYQSNSALGESVHAFHDFLKAYPNTAYAEQVYEILADVYMDSKNYKAALESVLSINQSNEKLENTKQYLRYQIGVDAFVQGNMRQTNKWMTEVIENAPKPSTYKTEALYYRAEAAYRLHNFQKCYDDLQLFLAQPESNVSPNKAMVDYLLGYSLFSMKRYGEAETIFKRYITHADPTHNTYADALNRLGDCCFNRRSFQEAEEIYHQVEELNRTGADYAIFQRGYALGLLRNYQKKAEVMEQLVSKYPKSDYADDALYETARARLEENNSSAATLAYIKLIQDYPNSNLARKASLELGMNYRNAQDYENAIKTFKQTIQNYSGSSEAYSALEGLEQIYVETNRVSEYLAYTKELGKINMAISNQDDSLTYTAAELQYMLGNYTDAIAGLTTYLSQYCSGGRYCTMATYYAADSHYRLGQKDEALNLFAQLLSTTTNPYMEEAATRAAEIAYDKKDYEPARAYFKLMRQYASKQKSIIEADLGILRSSYFLNDHTTTIDVATQLLSNDAISQEVRDEALYNRAKSLLAEEKYGLASVDFTPLSKDVRIVTGAEAKYWVAYCYYQLGALDNAEEEIMSFAGMKTQHQYWLAKAFILLSDINVQKGDLFQAKQYLLSLQNNYRNTTDDIHSIIAQHLGEIDKMMNASEEKKEVENDSIYESQEFEVEKEAMYE